ncbi:T9SS type A sorting domain-containing protein [Dokdonia sp.]|uniref:T9SS type A sorting domain-containing protein n=1 Tax=Dokdonia sp. TaxID=2024995 RepID=UPI0032646BCA
MKKWKLTLIIALLATVNTLFSQEVTTLASIESNYGDGMIITPEGDILVSGGFNKTNILKITLEGEVTEHVTGLLGPVGMGFDSDGNLYVSNYTGNTISKVTPEGTITEFASDLDGPAGLIVTENDEILVTLFGANFSGTGSTVLKFDLEGNSEIYASGNGILDAIGITVDENQDLFITNFVGGNVIKVDTAQNIETIATVAGAQINQIVYSNEYVYIPSPNLRMIYRVNTGDGSVEHFAGSGGSSTTDGELLEAEFNFPNSCTVNEAGDTLYVLDGQVGLIRAIDLETLGLNDSENTIGVKLFSNPQNDSITIQATLINAQKYTVSVYDTAGQLVKTAEGSIQNGNLQSILSTSTWSKGVYVVKIKIGETVVNRKFVKQ